MIFDIIAGVLVLAFAFIGWRAGSMLQIMRLITLVVATFFARTIGPEIAHFHASMAETCAPGGVVLAWFLITLGMLWAMVAFFTKRFAEDLRDASIDHATGDRLGGAVFGAAMGALLAYLLVAGLQVAKPNLAYEESAVGRFVDKKNLHDPGLGKVADLIGERWSTCEFEYIDEPERKWIGGRPGLRMRSNEIDD